MVNLTHLGGLCGVAGVPRLLSSLFVDHGLLTTKVLHLQSGVVLTCEMICEPSSSRIPSLIS